MEKQVKIAIIAIAIIIPISAILVWNSNQSDSAPLEPQNPQIRIFASFFPYYEFAKNVAGDYAIVKQFLPTGVEPHDWEPLAGEIQSLKDADVFVYNGVGMEPYVDKIIESGEFDHIAFVKASKDIELLKPEEEHEQAHAEEFKEEIKEVIEEFEHGHITEDQTIETIESILHEHEGDDHDHGEGIIEDIEDILHEIEDRHMDAETGLEEIHHLVSGEAHEKDEEHGHDHDFEFDPHIWLDPILVKQQVNNIKDGLVQADPENAQYYEKNAAAYNAKLDALDAKIKSELSDCQKDTFVPFHNAFTYFAKRYGLTVFSISGVTPSSEASASEIAAFVDFVKDNNIKVIFAEELIDPRLAEVIADEAGVQVMIFSPLEGLTPQEIADGVTFLDKMEQSLNGLKIALECR